MPTPAPAIVLLLQTFAVAFTRPTFDHALAVLYGTLLAPGRRTVTAALRAVGLADERHFTTYHRVLNRARWSPLRLSRVLLGLLVSTFLRDPQAPLVLLVDGTLERRGGRRIAVKGRFHDAVRSQTGHVVTTDGVHWVCLMVLVTVPWTRRPWALPVLSVPTLTPETSAALGKPHRTVAARTAVLVRLVRRWQPDREILLVGDSSFAVVGLAHLCNRLRVRLVSRLLLNAQLYDPVPVRPASTPGVKPKKGPRQPKLAARLQDPATPWQTVRVTWYSTPDVAVRVTTGTALWHRDGEAPLPVRWVLVRHPAPRRRPVALFCTDLSAAAERILLWYLDRWPIEVTFEEVRAHLGVETQRQWSPHAVARTTPCLLGLFSVTVLLAHRLHPENLPTRRAAWYAKPEPTFTDALAAVRRHLWASRNAPTLGRTRRTGQFPPPVVASLVDVACYAA